MSTAPDVHGIRNAQFHQLIEALESLEQARLPADRALDRFFRARRFLGGRDRRFIAEGVFGVLRRQRFFRHCLQCVPGQAAPAADLAGLHLLNQGWSERALASLLSAPEATRLSSALRAAQAESLPFAIRHSLPDVLADALVHGWGAAQAENLAIALAGTAPLDLRVNTLRADRAALQQRLAGAGIHLEPTPYAPHGLRRADRAALFQAPGFQEGAFEVQDEGSQLLAALVDVPPRGRVVDFCAGAGGKTLALAMQMDNKGEILACDVIPRKLEELARRARRAGAHNIRIQSLVDESDAALRAHRGRYDRVLVDAPCSGSGTLRRNPDLRNRPLDLPALAALQRRILDAAAGLVASGGRLIYATCSVMDAENREVVADFLRKHPDFTRLPAQAVMARAGLALPDTMFRDEDFQVVPHLHGTDGFYGAVLQRA
jgi:16S rRNA (cytosine967-C5)-methyltransferase